MEIKLPKGWQEINLKESVDFRKGKKPKILSQEAFKDAVPYMDIQALEKDIISYYADNQSAKYFKDNDVVIVWDGSRSGLILKPKSGAIGSTLGALAPYGYNSQYLYYYLLSHYKTINSKARGVGIPHVDPTYLWNLKLPLPPLAEQQRIVSKLDNLFAQHEKIKKALDRVPKLIKLFRQKILTQAVSGKLTKVWHDERKMKEWKSLQLIDVILDKPRNGYSPKAVEYVTSLKSLTLSATTSGRFNPSFVKYIDEKKPPSDSHLWLKYGDILIQRSNSLEYVGTAAIYDGKDFDFIYPDIMMKVRSSELIENKYLYYSLSSKSTKDYFKNNASGTAGNMPKINQEIVSRTPVMLPSLLEQQEIVRRVEAIFTKINVIELSYHELKKKVDTLPQAILHKAFKGELVKQFPHDGNAKDLLAEITAFKKEVNGKRGNL